MCGGGRHDVAAPGVLDGDLDAEVLGEIAHQLGLGEPTHLADLEVEGSSATLAHRTQHRRNVVHDLVVHHRQRRALAHFDALLHRRAGLLEVEPRQVLHQPRGDDRVVQPPTTVRISDHEVVIASCLDHLASAGTVDRWIAADLQLEAVDALATASQHVVGHLLRRAERHGHVKREAGLAQATEQGGDTGTECPAGDVPARDVERALRVFVTHQRRVHRVVDRRQVGGIEADNRRGQQRQCGQSTTGVAGQVGGAERADLAKALHAGVRRDPDDDRRQGVDHPPTRHDVAAVDVRELDAEDVDASDLHRPILDVLRAAQRERKGQTLRSFAVRSSWPPSLRPNTQRMV